MDAEASNARDHELVAHLGWVQGLALALARDRDAADDLAQDVSRVWLERRPVLGDGPRGWLTAVARRLALDRARSEGARRARERSVARPEAAGETCDVVERGARQRRVVEAVMELEEPYRATILYRFLDGLTTRAVAARMGVSEPAVRKRIERGLAQLRARLDREFGARSEAWALALLEPGLRNTLGKGAGILGLKSALAGGGVVLLVGAAWMLRADDGSEGERAGGRGELVVPEAADAREGEVRTAAASLEAPSSSGRSVPDSTAVREAPRLEGTVFVDGVPRVPPGLEIVVDNGWPGHPSADPAHASWSLEDLSGAPLQLWVTSDSTVPAQIPVPAGLSESGGVFDLQLSTGRTLELTFLDRETREPLAHLDFQLSRAIETERDLRHVTHRAQDSMQRTDGEGRTLVTGVPLTGRVGACVDFVPRERLLLMRDGQEQRMQTPGITVWFEELQEALPMRLERTILTSRPLGEASAGGQVPAWAGSPSEVRVRAHELTDDPHRFGTTYLLPQDPGGGFELRASAPSRHTVWLEGGEGQRLSVETEVLFPLPGPQNGIVFLEPDGTKVTLEFLHVPARGTLDVLIAGGQASMRSETLSCAGEPFEREFDLQPGEHLMLSLRLGERGDKAGWMRQIEPGDERVISIDLAGSERRVRLECLSCGLLAEQGMLALMRCEDGKVNLDLGVVSLLCADSRGTAPVLVPDGRWLFRYSDALQPSLWGVVDVTGTAPPEEELVLSPRVRLATAAELGAGIRLEEVEGVSLANLPESARELHAGGADARIAVPLDSRSVPLDEHGTDEH